MMDREQFLAYKIKTLMGMFPCVAVIGPRQCGKSTLVKAMYPDWKYYDLERPDNYQLITSDPLGFFPRLNTHNFRVFIQSLSYHSGRWQFF